MRPHVPLTTLSLASLALANLHRPLPGLYARQSDGGCPGPTFDWCPDAGPSGVCIDEAIGYTCCIKVICNPGGRCNGEGGCGPQGTAPLSSLTLTPTLSRTTATTSASTSTTTTGASGTTGASSTTSMSSTTGLSSGGSMSPTSSVSSMASAGSVSAGASPSPSASSNGAFGRVSGREWDLLGLLGLAFWV